MTQTPKSVIFIIVIALALVALSGVWALAGTLFYKNYADPAVLSAFISITSGAIGALGTLLANTRQAPPDTTTTTTTKPNPPPTPPEGPTPVVIEQPPTKPVPTTEVGVTPLPDKKP
jgi:hypothetical protein